MGKVIPLPVKIPPHVDDLEPIGTIARRMLAKLAAAQIANVCAIANGDQP